MAYEMLVGVNVVDEESYMKYRKGMMPILESYGGGFAYDFKIEKVMKSQSEKPINRVFTIYFKDQSAKEEFFANEDYHKVKQEHYVKAVTDSTIISEYEK